MYDYDIDPLWLELWLRHEQGDNRRREIWEANAALSRSLPAWRLDTSGTVIAANLSALWIWGARLGHTASATDAFLGSNVFDVFARNIDRLPIRRNESFWASKMRVERHLYPNEPGPFEHLREMSPELRELQGRALREDLSNVWSYSLSIDAPFEYFGYGRMEFNTTVSAVQSASRAPAGFVAIYEPIDETAELVESVYRRLLQDDHQWVAQSGPVRSAPAPTGARPRKLAPSGDRKQKHIVPSLIQVPSIPSGGTIGFLAVLTMFVLFALSASSVTGLVVTLVAAALALVLIAQTAADRLGDDHREERLAAEGTQSQRIRID